MRVTDVTIIGGGASGALVAIHLLKTLPADAQVCIVEPRPTLGRGVAYGTDFDKHLLNVRAIGMTAFPDDPQHFVRWLAATRNISVEEAGPIFAQRREYSTYISDLLEEHSRGRLRHVRDIATDIERRADAWRLSTAGGEPILTRNVILALGNQQPKFPPVLHSLDHDARLIHDPWSAEAFSNVNPNDRVRLPTARRSPTASAGSLATFEEFPCRSTPVRRMASPASTTAFRTSE